MVSTDEVDFGKHRLAGQVNHELLDVGEQVADVYCSIIEATENPHSHQPPLSYERICSGGNPR